MRAAFSFKTPVLPSSRELLDQIQQTNAVCLNVRRTDFLKVDTLNTTNAAYFHRGARYVAERIVNPVFFVFSDDMDWCRRNIRLDHEVEFVGHDHKGRKFGNYLQLMSHCKHFVIPNSSFAWWAVWLSRREDQLVVAPERWFNDPEIDTRDLVPENWIRL